MTAANKIIYFDSETIKNTLQEYYKGEKEKHFENTSKAEASANIEVGGRIKLGVPFMERFQFLFSGKLEAHFINSKEKTTIITSTELSEFEILKKYLKEFNNISIDDIENSSTFFRVAGGYLKVVQGGVEGVDVHEFKEVIDSFDGYDTYKISQDVYIRFNNTSFVSNYRRNDLLLTKMNAYGVFIGEFEKDQFDYIKQINKMEDLVTDVNSNKTLADKFPLPNNNGQELKETAKTNDDCVPKIKLYDIVYAWNEKLAEVWQLLTQSPETFKGGSIWKVILNINGAVQAIGLALLVLFFLVGVVRTSASLTEVKKPEHDDPVHLAHRAAAGYLLTRHPPDGRKGQAAAWPD